MIFWIKTAALVVLAIVLGSGMALWLNTNAKKNAVGLLVRSLNDSTPTQSATTVDFATLTHLPEPVQRYLRNVLRDGMPVINRVRLEQQGELRITPQSDKWSAFDAMHFASAAGQGFVWNARIAIAPLLHVRVVDAFIDGVGSGNVYMLSAFTLASETAVPELNTGALYRYLAEAVWYPTALLPQSGVRWEAIDANRAMARLTVAENSAALEFRFNSQGEVTGIYTEQRYGKFGDHYERHPWEGRFSNYQDYNGVKIPTEAEVGWHLPQGWWLFWRGRITGAEFEFIEYPG